MKHTPQIITLSSYLQKPAFWFKVIKLDLDPISESCFSKVQSANLNTEEMFLWLAQNILAKQLNHNHTQVSRHWQDYP